MAGLLAASKKDIGHLLLISLAILPLFVLTGRWGEVGNIDAFAAATPSWQFSRNATLDLSSYPNIANNLETLHAWFVEVDSGAVVSNRPPGVIASALPAYLVAGSKNFSNAPAVATALLFTYLALIVLWGVMKPLVGRTFATASVLVLAFGTTTWWIAASELWPHGPGQLWAALAVANLASNHYSRAGLFFGLSILTRPLTATFAAVTGVAEGWHRRSWKPVFGVGLTSMLGLLGLLVYNRLVFGTWSPAGGYSEDFTSGAVDRFNLASYASNFFSMFVGPRHGVLLTSPIIGVSAVGFVTVWRSAPSWARSTALAALAYLTVHALLNRASGGLVVFYRYPLEALALAAPALAIGAKALLDRGPVGRRIVIGTAIISVALQIVHVFYLSCYITDPVFRTCLVT